MNSQKPKYFSPSYIKDDFLKFRNLLGRIAAHFVPIAGNRIVFPLLLKTCMRYGSGFCLNPYLASYFFKEKLLVTLPLSRITHFMRDWVVINRSKMHMSDYFIGGGEWDEIVMDISTMTVLKEAQQLMQKDCDYKQTDVYKELIEKMKNSTPAKKQHILLDTSDKIDDYFLRFTAVYYSIKKHGFQNNLSDSRNIGIAIDKNGNISKLPGGQHRFSIAYVLNLPEISVEIRMIHREYLQKICSDYGLDYVDGVLKIAQMLSERNADDR